MAADSERDAPQVSIIMPARNEEVSLPACLESLQEQQQVRTEIIVVDDGSTDRTRAMAESFPGVLVLDAGALPEGWSGKCNALMTGARAASGRWLLLTDADTVHLPGSLAGALVEAESRGVDLLSYSPAQKVQGVLQSAVMPVIFAELAAHYPPQAVSDPGMPQAAANGQYLLVKRESYAAVGGHARVALTLLEDVALARNFKAAGLPIFFRYGGDRVRTRMYRTAAELRDGWTKNLALLFPDAGALATLRLAEFVLIAFSLLAATVEGARGNYPRAIVAASLGAVFLGLFWKRIRRAHFPLMATLLAPMGLPLFAWLLLRSRRAYRRGTVGWKGRVYGTPSTVATGLVQIAGSEGSHGQIVR
ncbi:MAG: glycosyltransferase [Acidobacteriales bacterium]|nr:glycosyltransferase [Terriglobales bacterium]